VGAKRLDDGNGPVQLARRAVGLRDDVLERVPPVRRTEDGATQVGDVSHHLRRELDEPAVRITLGIQNTVIPLPDPDDLPPDRPRGIDGGVDHRIQPRGVAPASVDGDALDVNGHGDPPCIYGLTPNAKTLAPQSH
jgi:hypothetical protein